MRKLITIVAAVALLLPLAGCSLLGKLGPDPLAWICDVLRDDLPEGWQQVKFCYKDGGSVTALVPSEKPPGIGNLRMTEIVARAVADAHDRERLLTVNPAADVPPVMVRVDVRSTVDGPVVKDLERQ